MRTLRIIEISRPPFWIIGPILYLFPFIYFNIQINPINIVQVISLTLPYCFFLFGINDIFDYKTDHLNPRKGKIQGALLTKNEFKTVFIFSIIFAVIVILISILTLNIMNIIFTLLLLLLSLAYSSPPRFKETPIIDSLTNAMIIFFIVLMGYSFSDGSIIRLFVICYPYLIAIVSIHTYTTILDYTPDKKAGVRTFSTVYGKRNSAVFSLIILVFSILMISSRNIFIWIFLAGTFFSYLITIILPEEKLAKNLTIFIFILFLICSAAFLFTKSSFPAIELINNLY